jgi:hypothetical protein
MNPSSSSSTVQVEGCTIVRTNDEWTTGYVFDIGCEFVLNDTKFYMGSLSTATGTRYLLAARDNSVVTGCLFSEPGSPSGAYVVFDRSLFVGDVVESGNFYGDNVKISFDTLGGSPGLFKSTSRLGYFREVTTTSASVTTDPEKNSAYHIEKTSGATLEITTVGLTAYGCPFIVSIKNTSGGALTVTFNSTYFVGVSDSIANNKTRIYTFIQTGLMTQIGTPRDVP